MTDVIEFPSTQVEADYLPQPGNRYQAYAFYQKFKPPRLAFVFPDWSMTMFPYDRMDRLNFRILNDQCDEDGDGMIEMTFGGHEGIYEIVVTGHNIFGLYFGLGDHVVNWVWELPKDRAAVKDGETVVHAIEIRDKPGTLPRRSLRNPGPSTRPAG